jgi:ActR/RegA family two-component response regulator
MADSILLIDDEAQFVETMAKRLRKRVFSSEAGGGQEGLRPAGRGAGRCGGS